MLDNNSCVHHVHSTVLCAGNNGNYRTQTQSHLFETRSIIGLIDVLLLPEQIVRFDGDIFFPGEKKLSTNIVSAFVSSRYGHISGVDGHIFAARQVLLSFINTFIQFWSNKSHTRRKMIHDANI